jgi:hypothetical protein
MARDAQARLDGFVTDLERALGDNAVSIVLFGDAVRGTIDAGRRTHDILLLLQDAAPSRLRSIGPTIARWVKSGEPPPLIFTQRGWRASSDVFPIEMEDMREAHRVLRGADPFDGITTTTADLRRELEREIRGKLLQLRSEYAAAEADGKALGELLAASVGTFFVLFRAVLRAGGTSPPQEPGALARATGDAAGLDAGAFDWAVQRVTGGKPRALQPYDEVGARYVEAIERLAEFVDGMGRGV